MRLRSWPRFLLCSLRRAHPPAPPAQTATPAAANQNDFQISAVLAQEFNKDRFKDVHFDVKNGVVTLKGSVALYADKEAAEKKAFHAKKAHAIRNEISVTGTPLSDNELQANGATSERN